MPDILKSLGLIPARSGSKRLPNKNRRELNGKPLFLYTVEAALQSKLTDVVFSTDCPEMAETARQNGAEVPFVRPADISDDRSTNKDVLMHALEFMEVRNDEHYDIVMVLQPTSPIREPGHIDECIRTLCGPQFDTVASVAGPVSKRQKTIKIRGEKGELQDYREGLLCDYYQYNGSIYGAKRDYFAATKDYHSGRQFGFVMDKLHSVDIDDEIDFEIASLLLKRIKT